MLTATLLCCALGRQYHVWRRGLFFALLGVGTNGIVALGVALPSWCRVSSRGSFLWYSKIVIGVGTLGVSASVGEHRVAW